MVALIEIIIFIAGIAILVTGKANFGKPIEGDHARFIGLILIMPFCVTFLMGYQIGQKAGRAGGFNQEFINDLVELSNTEFILNIIAIGITFGLVRQAPTAINPPAPVKQELYDLVEMEYLPSIINLVEAARLLKTSPEQVRYLIDTGQLAAVRVKDDYRIAKQAVMDFLERKK